MRLKVYVTRAAVHVTVHMYYYMTCRVRGVCMYVHVQLERLCSVINKSILFCVIIGNVFMVLVLEFSFLAFVYLLPPPLLLPLPPPAALR